MQDERVTAAAVERRVLPRPLRRVIRFCAALVAGRIAIPNHTGTLSAAAFFAATGLYGMVVGGHTPTVAQALTTSGGFSVEDVKISGNVETSEIDILQHLGLDGTSSLVSLDINEARRRLADLPWIADAEIRKVYPGTVEVKLKERQAYAIWQHGTELSLIEKSGSVIEPLRDNKFANLPLFVGRDAEQAAETFETLFTGWPELRQRVKAYVRVAGRRWDLHLDNGVVVRLPEDGVDAALERLARLEGKEQVLERDIVAVDLRLDDRMTIQLTPDAEKRRLVAVEARAKALKKAGQNI